MSMEDHTHREIDSLGYEVSSLRSKLDELNELTSELQYELHEADESFTGKLDEVSRELSDGLAEISQAVALLASRVEWLERFVRQSDGTPRIGPGAVRAD